MNNFLSNIKYINKNREALEPLFTTAFTAAISDTFNIISILSKMVEEKDAMGLVFPKLAMVIKEEETRSLLSRVDKIKRKREGGSEDAINDFKLIAANNFMLFKSIDKKLFMLEKDGLWNKYISAAIQCTHPTDVLELNRLALETQTR